MPAKLNPTQTIAAALIASGTPKHLAAKEVGVHPATISEWLQNKYFRIAVENFRESTVYAIRDRVRSLGSKAVDVIEELLTSPKDTVKLKAALYVLDTLKVVPKEETPALWPSTTKKAETPFAATGDEIEAYQSAEDPEQYVVPDPPSPLFKGLEGFDDYQ